MISRRAYARACLGIASASAFAAVSTTALDGAAGEGEILTLFQMVARADLVAHVRTREGALKYAVVVVLESLKGEPPGDVLRVDFRGLNWARPPGQDPMVLPDGQEEILFLVQDPRARRKEKYRDLFWIHRGTRGRITVPAEGAGIPLEAVRRLVTLTRSDPSSQADGLLDLLTSPNPYLAEAALDEVARLRAARPATVPDLVALLRSASSGVRLRSLRLLEQILGTPAAADDAGEADPGLVRVALEAALERARNDPVAEVRVEAVSAIGAWPAFPDVEAELRAIARIDPDQMVRYQAERLIFRRGEGGGAGRQVLVRSRR